MINRRNFSKAVGLGTAAASLVGLPGVQTASAAPQRGEIGRAHV